MANNVQTPKKNEFKILVADRDAPFRDTVQKILKNHFMQVSTAENGPKVLALCERSEFDLVIVGNHLPGMLGIEVVRRLERNYPKMCRILTSDQDTDPVIESALEYGIIDRFLQRPLEVNDIVWEVEYLLGITLEPPSHHLSDTTEVDDDNEDQEPEKEGLRYAEEKQLLLQMLAPRD